MRISKPVLEAAGDVLVSLMLGAVMFNASGIWQWGVATLLAVFLLLDWLRQS